MNFKGFDLIAVYTRRRAIQDGVLIDVSETAKECGFAFPVAITSAVSAECVRVPEGCDFQDEKGRLWDVLWMARVAIQQSHAPNPTPFGVSVQTAQGQRRTVRLRVECHLGDDGKPVLTIMLPDED